MRVIHVDASTCTAHDLAEAVSWLRSGLIVAFPTDTLYGLAVDPQSPEAVQRLFDLKSRGAAGALPLVAASREQVAQFSGGLKSAAARLAEIFWPGPLSLLVDAPAAIAPAVHAGTGAVAIRVPDHRVARALADAWGAPVTATSANRSGEPPAASAEALGALASDSRILLIDGGPAPGGPPSTIVDPRGRRPVLIREGAIAWSRVLGSIDG